MPVTSNINSIEEYSARPVDVSVAFVLLWIATNNTNTQKINSNRELKNQLTTLSLEKQTIYELFDLAKQQQDQDLIQVFDLLSRELSQEEKQFLLEMAVAVTIQSEHLSPSSNHILRFIADFLALGEKVLADVYYKQNNQFLNDPEDLSSCIWWEKNEKTQQDSSALQTSFSRKEALAVLGLGKEASAGDIKRAYRRMVQLYHPDRHEKEGQASAEAAEIKFVRIQKAYEVLKR